ncbi:MAG: 30S ribosomal protein S9 [Candidatus Levybacteria bacterium]|nr:30S ribosomal protein S9 [Candidatus Levybacteria bacterium]
MVKDKIEEKVVKTKSDLVKTKNDKKDFIFAVGRRKEAVARVRLYPNITDGMTWGDLPLKKGEIYVNNKPIDQYFNGESNKVSYREPFRVTNTINKYTITVKIAGGGNSGQLDALIHGVARVLEKVDGKFRPILKKKGFLTRDARVRERRKVGMGGKSRREKQSPKR